MNYLESQLFKLLPFQENTISVLLRVEKLLGFFKRFTEEYLNMDSRVLDYTIVWINDRNNFNHVKKEALKFIKIYKDIT